MPTNDSTHLRTIAAGLIISADNMVLLGRKDSSSYYPDCWHLPGGGVKDGETPEQALVREIQEETGINLEMEQALIEMADDQGRGEHIKTDSNGRRILVEMEFLVFKVTLAKTSAQMEARPGSDLEELRWVDLKQLSELKHTLPSRELFERLRLG